jgi:hypothetical protein
VLPDNVPADFRKFVSTAHRCRSWKVGAHSPFDLCCLDFSGELVPVSFRKLAG